ncbi:MAG: hypothetical protein EVJ46_03490 [Candidatus Acididesulfobacter guangdongensis]|uniref:4Fe-4S ferredoxin-type domain-containing protein n=1 Tax=Acididesulfobacter guangdongensis TaxID=2597225 RepID=A0A519BJ63_ACIG2|nr:MAG: hypothetical protein EVJ46_03490 [Candidatus Acididesulfobacter guangdongensis]
MAIWTYNGLKFGIKSVNFPKENDFYEGFFSYLKFDTDKCLNFKETLDSNDLPCLKCQEVCPTGAIDILNIYDSKNSANYANRADKENRTGKIINGADNISANKINKIHKKIDKINTEVKDIIDIKKCIYCGLCVSECSNIAEAVSFSNFIGKDNINEAHVKNNIKNNAKNSDKKKFGFFKKSLFVKHIDSGSCGACESEITALNNPYYNMHRLGIFITPSPRFADVILLTGVFTDRMSDIFYNVLDNTPNPRFILLAGVCPISGGIWSSSARHIGGSESRLNNSGFLNNKKNGNILKTENIILVPGCPPNPFMILNVLLSIKSGGFAM